MELWLDSGVPCLKLSFIALKLISLSEPMLLDELLDKS